MFEGQTVLNLLELSHILMKDHKISLTEFYNMLPWMLEVKLSMITNDYQESINKNSQTV